MSHVRRKSAGKGVSATAPGGEEKAKTPKMVPTLFVFAAIHKGAELAPVKRMGTEIPVTLKAIEETKIGRLPFDAAKIELGKAHVIYLDDADLPNSQDRGFACLLKLIRLTMAYLGSKPELWRNAVFGGVFEFNLGWTGKDLTQLPWLASQLEEMGLKIVTMPGEDTGENQPLRLALLGGGNPYDGPLPSKQYANMGEMEAKRRFNYRHDGVNLMSHAQFTRLSRTPTPKFSAKAWIADSPRGRERLRPVQVKTPTPTLTPTATATPQSASSPDSDQVLSPPSGSSLSNRSDASRGSTPPSPEDLARERKSPPVPTLTEATSPTAGLRINVDAAPGHHRAPLSSPNLPLTSPLQSPPPDLQPVPKRHFARFPKAKKVTGGAGTGQHTMFPSPPADSEGKRQEATDLETLKKAGTPPSPKTPKGPGQSSDSGQATG